MPQCYTLTFRIINQLPILGPFLHSPSHFHYFLIYRLLSCSKKSLLLGIQLSITKFLFEKLRLHNLKVTKDILEIAPLLPVITRSIRAIAVLSKCADLVVIDRQKQAVCVIAVSFQSSQNINLMFYLLRKNVILNIKIDVFERECSLTLNYIQHLIKIIQFIGC